MHHQRTFAELHHLKLRWLQRPYPRCLHAALKFSELDEQLENLQGLDLHCLLRDEVILYWDTSIPQFAILQFNDPGFIMRICIGLTLDIM